MDVVQEGDSDPSAFGWVKLEQLVTARPNLACAKCLFFLPPYTNSFSCTLLQYLQEYPSSTRPEAQVQISYACIPNMVFLHFQDNQAIHHAEQAYSHEA